MNIGPTIKKLRKQKGLNQKEFSAAIDISQTALSQIETGLTKPQKTTLNKICEELNVPEQVLILLSLEESDVPEKNKDLYDTLYPAVKDFITKIFYEDDKKVLASESE